jgi:hypothetical protein
MSLSSNPTAWIVLGLVLGLIVLVRLFRAQRSKPTAGRDSGGDGGFGNGGGGNGGGGD